MGDINIKTIFDATKQKPDFGQSCNQCGWCCMTEVCAIGKELGGGDEGPCNKLYESDGKYLCQLAAVPEIRKHLAIDTSCDAKTQREVITELMRR